MLPSFGKKFDLDAQGQVRVALGRSALCQGCIQSLPVANKDDPIFGPGDCCVQDILIQIIQQGLTMGITTAWNSLPWDRCSVIE